MKKKWLGGIIILVLLVCSIVLVRNIRGEKPFHDLTTADIKEAAVELRPPQIKLSVNKDELKELVKILNKVTIYKRDDSYKEYAGQFVQYTIVRNDGSQLIVIPYNPFIIIDGIGYRTKYKPCEDLNKLANDESGKDGNE